MNLPPLHRLRVCPPCAYQSATGMRAESFDDAPVAYFQSHKVDDVCSICHEEFDQPSTQCPEKFKCKQVLFLENCSHVFHMACIAQSAEKGRRECPECRKALSPQDLKDIEEASGKKFEGASEYMSDFDAYATFRFVADLATGNIGLARQNMERLRSSIQPDRLRELVTEELRVTMTRDRVNVEVVNLMQLKRE